MGITGLDDPCAMTPSKALAVLKSDDLKKRQGILGWLNLVFTKASPASPLQKMYGSLLDCIHTPPQEVKPVLVALLSDRDDRLRRNTISFLGSTKDPAWVDLIGERALKDKDPWVRNHALSALNMNGTPAIIPWLEKSLNEDDFPGNRGTAADALGIAQGQAALPALKAAFEREKDKIAKLWIARALGNRGDDSGQAVALENLEDKDPQAREQAAYALGFIGKKEFLPALRKHLEDPDKGVQFKALESSKRIEYKAKSYPDNLKFLETSLDDKSGTVRIWAASEMFRMKRPEALNKLKEKARKGHEESRNILNWNGIDWYQDPTKK
jgi:HEAT repeat protein